MGRHDHDVATETSSRGRPDRSTMQTAGGRTDHGHPWRLLAALGCLAVGLTLALAMPVTTTAVAASGEATPEIAGVDTAAPTAAESSLVVTDATTEPGDTATHRLVLTEAPNGLAGFETTLEFADDTATVSNASYPEEYRPTTDPIMSADGQSVTVEAADLTDEVTSGATNVTLATIEVRGTDARSTALRVTDAQVDADGGSKIAPSLEAGTLTVADDALAASTQNTDEEAGEVEETDADDSNSSDTVPGFAVGAALAAIAVLTAGLLVRRH
ncbi:hypothetical protein [Natrinema sp. SYSU A 869]|uniref:hypothetical protein n=1 Tax=Natrinema sp. SYSU A 869 TaxID=2871694 RepID=UPI001CA42EF0|nr:hypothetical protein [Natrinema sp. SYSU A 869]